MGSHSVTCHPTQVNVPRLNPSQTDRQEVYSPTLEKWKAELTWVVGHTPKLFSCPKTVTHPSSNRAQRRATALIGHKVLTTRPRDNKVTLVQTASAQHYNCMGSQLLLWAKHILLNKTIKDGPDFNFQKQVKGR